MSERIIIVQDRQSIWDIAIREYGSVEGVFRLLEDNPDLTGLDAPLSAGQSLVVRQAPVDTDVVRWYADRGLYPVTEYEVPPVELQCSERPTSVRIQVDDDFSGAALVEMTVTSTHVRYTPPAGPAQLLEVVDGFIDIALANGANCWYTCNAAGEPSGHITAIGMNNMAVASIASVSGFALLEELYSSELEFTADMVLPSMPLATYVQLLLIGANDAVTVQAPNLNSFEINAGGLISNLDVGISLPFCSSFLAIGLALTEESVDRNINAMNPGVLNGTIAILGGTSSPPGAASAARRTALDGAGWDQTYN